MSRYARRAPSRASRRPTNPAGQRARRDVTCLLYTSYAGGGIISAEASADLLEFAERSQIPVATTLMGIGAMPELKSNGG